MKPRLPFRTTSSTGGASRTRAASRPKISAARSRFIRSVHGMDHVDPVTTELVRIRNARHQTCYF